MLLLRRNRMKKLLAVMVLCSFYNTAHSMGYLNNLRHPWQTYVHWRYKDIIDPLAESKERELSICQKAQEKMNASKITQANSAARERLRTCKNTLVTTVEDELAKDYENKVKPWYVKMFSYVSPKEPEESVLKRVYNELSNSFNDAFYPDPKSRSNLFINPMSLTKDQNDVISRIVLMIQDGLNGTVTKKGFFNADYKNNENELPGVKNENEPPGVKQRIDALITSLNGNPNVTEADKDRFIILQKKMVELKTEVDSPRPWIEQWHRNKVANRIKGYFGLAD